MPFEDKKYKYFIINDSLSYCLEATEARILLLEVKRPSGPFATFALTYSFILSFVSLSSIIEH